MISIPTFRNGLQTTHMNIPQFLWTFSQKGIQKGIRKSYPVQIKREYAPAVFFSNMEGCAVSGTTLALQDPSASLQTIPSEIGRFPMDHKIDRKKGSKTQNYYYCFFIYSTSAVFVSVAADSLLVFVSAAGDNLPVIILHQVKIVIGEIPIFFHRSTSPINVTGHTSG